MGEPAGARLAGRGTPANTPAGRCPASSDYGTVGHMTDAAMSAASLRRAVAVGPPPGQTIRPHQRCAPSDAARGVPGRGPSAGVSRVDAEASGYLVVPPVFKTGERCAAALAGSIPVRLRHLHRYQIPRRLRGTSRAGYNGHNWRVLAQCWHTTDDHAHSAASARARRGCTQRSRRPPPRPNSSTTTW